jgi:hypothetical protein
MLNEFAKSTRTGDFVGAEAQLALRSLEARRLQGRRCTHGGRDRCALLNVASVALSARGRAEEDFARYLAVERGLAPATLVNYVPFVSQLLTERYGRGPIRLRHLRAKDIIGFVQRHAYALPRAHQAKCSPPCVHSCVTCTFAATSARSWRCVPWVP